MFKITLKLFLVLIVLAAGSFGADQAVAAQDYPVPVISTDDQVQAGEDLIFEMNGAIAGGNDGDPDSAGDGLGFMGDFIFNGFGEGIQPGGERWNEMLRIWLERLVPQP